MNTVNALCGVYTATADSILAPMLVITGQNLAVQTSSAGSFNGTLTLTRNNNTSMKITTTLTILVYDCNPYNFALASSSVSLELLSAAMTVTWSHDSKHVNCGGYTVTSSNAALVLVGAPQTVSVLTGTATVSTVTLTLKRDSNTLMTATTTMTVNIYDCHPIGFALSQASISIELSTPSQAITWS